MDTEEKQQAAERIRACIDSIKDTLAGLEATLAELEADLRQAQLVPQARGRGAKTKKP